MRLTPLLLLGLLSACSPDKGDGGAADTSDTSGHTGVADSADSADSAETGGDSSDSAMASLNGTPPDDPVTMPDFRATNRDGAGRGPEDLRGHPTALWFYPAANTGG